jgi:transcription antitermination factor NusG
VLMTPGVIQIVGVGKTPIPVAEEEISAIRLVGKVGLPTMPWPYLEVGHVVRIEEGPLQGLTGIVLKIKSGLKLVLSVSLLQRSVAVEIDRRWVNDTQAGKAGASVAQAGRSNAINPFHLDPMGSLTGRSIEAD